METVAFLTLLVAVIALGYKVVRDSTSAAAKAKDAQIELLKTEIENLQIQTSTKMRESFVQMKQHLEDTIKTLETGVSERDHLIEVLHGLRENDEARIRELTGEGDALKDRIRQLDVIIEDEVVNHLDEFGFTFVSLKLSDADDDAVYSFIDEARAIGDMPYHAYHLHGEEREERRIRMRYKKRVSQRTIHQIIRRLGLKQSELVVVQGFDFKSATRY